MAAPTPKQSNQPTQSSTSTPFTPPAIALPKGGGAVRDMGEKFAANPVTGTTSITVPLPFSPGRSGFAPQLSLAYDSAAGNGPFGFGWQLSLPAITRKTDKGLPRYDDANESDVFILSSSEDLVPVLVPDAHGRWNQRDSILRTVDGVDYGIQRYRPRVEGVFALIERWTDLQSGEIHWRTITKENVTNLYGTDNNSRIFDPNDSNPAHPTRIFTWLICESRDGKGNAILYHYKEENSENVDMSQANEANRTLLGRSANRYLKSVKYGNRLPTFTHGEPSQNDWLFEAIFDYGEHDPSNPTPDDTAVPWLCRHDPFSTHRSTFEVRTYRLCQRVLMFHHFPGESNVGANCLIRSTDFVYRSARNDPEDEKKGDPVASFIASAVQNGFSRSMTGTTTAYVKQSLPPLEFEYSEVHISSEIRDVDPTSLENLPMGLAGNEYRWVDLDGEGLGGILTEQAGTWFYKRNESTLNRLGKGELAHYEAMFSHVEVISLKPSLALSSGSGSNNNATGDNNVQLLDLDGSGRLDVVQFSQMAPGFYERRNEEEGGWAPFVAFQSMPNVDWRNPNLRFVDLNGDGFADVLITENEALTWYPSLAHAGFGPGQYVGKAWDDEEKGPMVVFSDGEQAIYLADMSGDGLNDLVRIRNGNVCYWPNLGFGRFGAKVAMDNAPWFDPVDQFDNRNIRLADIDGSGTTDLLYLGNGGVGVYRNEAGNGWTPPTRLEGFPPIDQLANVSVNDLLGNGTACLVWSSQLPGNTGHQMRYVDLMGGTKPHLLVRIVNNLGAETRVHYAPSTRFYLQDKRDGNPWITRLPFPVHVVELVETFDRISRNHFTTRYAYHHGYFDGVEREFRGFGMVEQWDTEEFAVLRNSDTALLDSPSLNIDEASLVPPVLTKTWIHTGYSPMGVSGNVSTQFAREYYREGGLNDEQYQAMMLPDTLLPSHIRFPDGTMAAYTLSAQEMREASRALKGSILRQETYGLDGSEAQGRPYKVSERNFTIELLQPVGLTNAHAVFLSHPREIVDFDYERTLTVDPGSGNAVADPRVTHSLVLAVDGFGNVLKSVAVGYGRRRDDTNPMLTSEDREKQKRALVTYTENRYSNTVREDDAYLGPVQCEAMTYELLKVVRDNSDPLITTLFRFDDVYTQIQSTDNGRHDLPYEDVTGSGAVQDHVYRRLVEGHRTLYRKNDLSAPLPLGEVESLALPFESYRQAATPGLVRQIYVDSGKMTAGDLDGVMGSAGAGNVHSEGDSNWWVPSGKMFFSSETGDSTAQELAYAHAHFYLPLRFRDPFYTASVNTETVVTYDIYDLLVQETRSPLGNRVTVGERNVDPTRPLVRRGQDYRVLQPVLTMDPNRNRSMVAFDALGLVTGTAVMGKPEESLGDSLEGFEATLSDVAIAAYLANPFANPSAILIRASTRIVYDLFAYRKTRGDPEPQPIVIATLAREIHDADLTAGQETVIQHSFTYSDGLGRDIQTKGQAEPGPVPKRDPVTGSILVVKGQLEMTAAAADPRWVGTGWTIFNNKGNPVRQYEPFFTDTHHFEFDLRIGVSPVTFYDPLERKVAVLNPNHTWSKVVFDAWRQETWDNSDTVLIADPKTDPDVQDFFRRLPDADYLPSWYSQRQSGVLGPLEQISARKAAVHAATPTVAHYDALGRTFLTVSHNKYQHSDNGSPVVEDFHLVRALIDIEGNRREVIDAKDRVVMRFDYDMLGTSIHLASMESGERWMLNDVAGKPFYHWNSRGNQIRTMYDPQRRPVGTYLRNVSGAEVLVERIQFGEGAPSPEAHNLRGQTFQAFDQAGTVVNADYDFKGNLLSTQRQFAQEYKAVLDWSAEVALETATYTTHTAYDAINRATQLTSPDGSITRPIYGKTHLLQRIDANLLGSATNTTFISTIEYDAKGQPTGTEYGNGARTMYTYDPVTFRLTNMTTRRDATAFPGDCPGPDPVGWPGCQVQNLSYTYDTLGNIMHIRDDAQQTIYFDNQRVDPSNDYTYDSISRLIEATGREHLGQAGHPTAPDGSNNVPHDPRNGNAMGTYVESYEYDTVGNILAMRHHSSNPTNPGWTRNYFYNEQSQLETGKMSNRLSATSIGSVTEPYRYDGNAGLHGNITGMAFLPMMQWNYRDQLHATSKQVVNNGGTPETTWYVYDAKGIRVRKTTERQTAAGVVPTRMKERFYVGGFEAYKQYENDGTTVSLERETLHIQNKDQRVALVETRVKGNDPAPPQLIRYQFSNHLGSAVLELDDQARIICYEEYTPFGSSSYQAVRSEVEAPKRYRYTGKERDEENGLYYYGARYYVHWIGRWISCDPGGLEDGLDVYVYVRCNPVNLRDPDGNRSWTSWVVGGIQVVAGVSEIVVGVAAVASGGGAIVGVAAIVHGASDLYAGIATIKNDKIENTPIQRLAAGGARFFGAGEETAEYIGTGVDLVAGIGTSTGAGLARAAAKRAAISGAEEAAKDTTIAIAKKAAAEGATETAEKAVQKGAVEATKEVAEKAAPKVAATTAAEAVTEAAPKTAAKAASEAAPDAAKAAAAQSTKSAKTAAVKAAGSGGSKVWKKGASNKFWHHLYPQEMADFFKRMGINIHEAGVELTQLEHDAVHAASAGRAGWNAEWKAWILEQTKSGNWTKLTKEDVVKQMLEMKARYGIGNTPLSKWFFEGYTTFLK